MLIRDAIEDDIPALAQLHFTAWNQSRGAPFHPICGRLKTGSRYAEMIKKLKSGEYRLYSRKPNPKTRRRRNLGTFGTLAAAKRHERAVQFFKRRG